MNPSQSCHRIAVTGATGFLGGHLVLQLIARGYHVVALVRDLERAKRLQDAGVDCRLASLEDPDAMRAACQDAEIVFHLAGAVDFGSGEDRCIRTNVDGVKAIAEAAQAAGARKFIHVSSIVAVGANSKPIPIDESFSWNLDRLHIPYVSTKHQGELVALAMNQPGFEVVVANPSCIIGPDDFLGSEFGILCKRYWKGRIPIYFGGGTNFVDVRDVATGLIACATHGRGGERYLLSGVNRTYRDFFADLGQIAGKMKQQVRMPNWLGRLAGSLAGLKKKPNPRPYLSKSQAKLMGWYFWYDPKKAKDELGYATRDWQETLRDTFQFWMKG
jgi:dihydroflavonol-4-reductase